MIRVDRNAVGEPSSLSRKAKGGRMRGKTEAEAIIAEYAAYLAATPPPAKGFAFPFAAYKNGDVKDALFRLFHGKCAYCEQRYAGTQPMDVEHWRPKGGVKEPGVTELGPGYPWLAATWSNLLPSCIDCNRPRSQHDALTKLDGPLGKANQFPVAGARMPAPRPHEPPPPSSEEPLIIDPTADDPALHLRFRDDGIVTALSPKGAHSLGVYALNRADLVFERLGLARLIEQRLTTIEALATVISNPELDEEIRRDLQDLVSHEIDSLLSLADPERPFSAMARQLIDESAPWRPASDPHR